MYRLGHTGLTWSDELVSEAVADVAALGFDGFEAFAWLIEDYPGGVDAFRALLGNHGLPLVSAYCDGSLIEPTKKDDDIDRILRHGRMLKSLGGSVIVLGATRRRPTPYTAGEYAGMVRTLDEIGQRCFDEGLLVCFHPHAGTPVETREEIDRVVGSVDPRVVFLAPDTGHISKGGGDPVEVYRTYRSMIRHVHLKDYIGGRIEFDEEGNEIDPTGHLSYVPLGMGAVDFPAILDVLDDVQYDGFLNVELNWTPRARRPARDSAAISKRYLDALLASRSSGAR